MSRFPNTAGQYGIFFINKLPTVAGPAGSGGDAGEEDCRHPALGGGVEAHHPHGGTERPLRPHLQC
jgi:hypothetical protein